MTKFIFRVAVLGLFCTAFAASLLAGAWTPKRGALYLKLSTTDFESTRSFNQNGDEENDFALFEDLTTSLYFEYGLRDDLGVFGSVNYKEIRRSLTSAGVSVGISESGFSDVDLGLRYNLLSGKHVLSAALMAKLPYLYEDDPFFPLGNRQEDLEARILYGRGLHPFYFGFEAGYRWRLEEPGDEVRLLGEAGLSVGNNFYFRTKLDSTNTRGNFSEPAGFGNPAVTPSFDLLKMEFTAGWKIKNSWSVEASYNDLIEGRNTAAGDTLQVAVVWAN